MKKIKIVFALSLISIAAFAQDSIPDQNELEKVDKVQAEKVITDTVRIETVRVDTVYVEKENPRPEETKTKSPEESTQKTSKKNDNVYYGLNATFSFGKYSFVGFEPLIAYKLLPKLSIGGKLSYEYFKNKNYSPSREGSNYGISVFTRLRILRKLYAHLEFAEMNYKLFNSTGESSSREWIPFLYVGGGISQPIAKNVSINAEVLWDILQNGKSPHKSIEPFFNVGIGVGF